VPADGEGGISLFQQILIFLGPTGLFGVLLAWFGFKREEKKSNGGPLPDSGFTIAALYADRAALQNLSDTAKNLNESIEELGKKFEEVSRLLAALAALATEMQILRQEVWKLRYAIEKEKR